MNLKDKLPKGINRREFVQLGTGALMAMGTMGLNISNPGRSMKNPSKIVIKNVDSNFERVPMRPYRFKGGVSRETWHSVAYLEAESGISKVGLGKQGILWSDAEVFFNHSVTGGNSLMYAMTERALQILKGSSFT